MPPAERPIGNLRQRPNGNWQSQARQPGNGKLISKTWRTTSKAEARRLHAQWIADVIGGRAGAAGPTLEAQAMPIRPAMSVCVSPLSRLASATARAKRPSIAGMGGRVRSPSSA